MYVYLFEEFLVSESHLCGGGSAPYAISQLIFDFIYIIPLKRKNTKQYFILAKVNACKYMYLVPLK